MNKHQLTTLADDFVFLEGPRWHNGQLWISDMWDLKVLTLTLDGKKTTVCDVPNRPSGLGFLLDGTPLVVSMADRKLLAIKNGKTELYVDLSNHATGDVNDLLVDEKGRAYVGNFGYDLFAGAEAKTADISLVDTDKNIRRVADNLIFPNGMVKLADGKTLVVAETWGYQLTAYDIADDGGLSNRRVFASLGERTPDGICIDKEDGIWVSCFESGEFIRVLEGGEITDLIECEDKRAVACALGGIDGKTLFCSTFAGGLEEIHLCKRAGAIETLSVSIPGQGF